jgi:hypothetical protein
VYVCTNLDDNNLVYTWVGVVCKSWWVWVGMCIYVESIKCLLCGWVTFLVFIFLTFFCRFSALFFCLLSFSLPPFFRFPSPSSFLLFFFPFIFPPSSSFFFFIHRCSTTFALFTTVPTDTWNGWRAMTDDMNVKRKGIPRKSQNAEN